MGMGGQRHTPVERPGTNFMGGWVDLWTSVDE